MTSHKHFQPMGQAVEQPVPELATFRALYRPLDTGGVF